MRTRNGSLAGGLLAAVALLAPAMKPAVADTISSPVFEVTDLGVAEAKGVNNANQVFGSSGGRAFTTGSLLPEDVLAGTAGLENDPKTPLENLGNGYNVAYGVNDQGQVVGQYQVKTEQGASLQPYLQTEGTTQQIDTLGGRYGGALGINASGQVVGSSETADGHEHGFIFDSATNTLTDVGTFGGENSDARAINDSGQVVGSAQTADGAFNAYLRSGEEMTNLGTLGGQNSWGFALNASGQVAGASETEDGRIHAFVTIDGQMIDLGSLAQNSFASAINSEGIVVGWNTTESNSYSAFLWNGEEMLDLNNFLTEDSPFASLNGATGINDAGQIVGWGTLASGGQHAFLMTADGPIVPNPIPEPTTVAFFGLIAAVGVAHRYRRRAALASSDR